MAFQLFPLVDLQQSHYCTYIICETLVDIVWVMWLLAVCQWDQWEYHQKTLFLTMVVNELFDHNETLMIKIQNTEKF
jgi:hypothetical protein